MISFEAQVLTALDKIEKKLDLIEERHTQLSERVIRLEVKLENISPPKSGLLRDGGIGLSSGAVAAIISFFAQHWK